MIDEKTLIAIIARSTQAECRQMGDLFLSFASAPRDVHWDAQMRRTLAMFPDPPASSLTIAIREANDRVKHHNDDLWRQGWHPDQMRRELEARGYAGNERTHEG